MSIVTINSAKTVGLKAVNIVIETEVSHGLGIHLVGLANQAVHQSLLRTVTAMQSQGYHIPGKKIVINLAPADLHKTGEGYDLAIALGIIAASGQAYLPDTEGWLVLGELGLDGSVRAVKGCVPAVLMAKERGLSCIIPAANAKEVAPYVGNLPVYAVSSLMEAIRAIRQDDADLKTVQEMEFAEEETDETLHSWDLLVGNDAARRAIEIAAAGGHHVLLIGAPGSGKGTIAKALAALLPPMTDEEKTEVARLYSVAGLGVSLVKGKRPFRAPHISASISAMLGGGAGDAILPGEVSLSSEGVLFLDEFAEAPKSFVKALRGPLEDRKVIISRLKSRVEFPARFQLVAASNPCPCGYYGEGDRCTCTPRQRLAYLSHLSGPVMDSIAIQVWVHPVSDEMLAKAPVPEALETVRERVANALRRQHERYDGTSLRTNDDLGSADLENYVKLDDECQDILEKIMDRLGLSARAYSRILKIARTIADLDDADDLRPEHIAEAASFRFLDRRDVFDTDSDEGRAA